MRVGYGRHDAVHGATLAVHEREVVGLIGPNGFGFGRAYDVDGDGTRFVHVTVDRSSR